MPAVFQPWIAKNQHDTLSRGNDFFTASAFAKLCSLKVDTRKGDSGCLLKCAKSESLFYLKTIFSCFREEEVEWRLLSFLWHILLSILGFHFNQFFKLQLLYKNETSSNSKELENSGCRYIVDILLKSSSNRDFLYVHLFDE